MSDVAMLMCHRVGEPGYRVANAMQKLCDDCGAGIWVSMASLIAVHSHHGLKVKLCCIQCGLPQLPKGCKIEEPSDGQLAEIAAAMRRRLS